MRGRPLCDCSCSCSTGCRDCDDGCTSRQARPIDDGGYDDYLIGYGRRTPRPSADRQAA